jgi:drug/metabolite transporter (DMT)-like permease
MISSATKLPREQHKPFTRPQSVILVFICTVFGAAAQVLMKIGGAKIHGIDPIHLLMDLPLLAGYAFYGLNTLMLMVALRDGELSKLYPIIALTYVWVNILSYFFFHEIMNVWKVSGILAIMAGVSVLGQSSKKSVAARA